MWPLIQNCVIFWLQGRSFDCKNCSRNSGWPRWREEFTRSDSSKSGSSRRNGCAGTVYTINVRCFLSLGLLLIMQIYMHIQQNKNSYIQACSKVHKSGVKFHISEGNSLKIWLNRVALTWIRGESVLMKNVNAIGIFPASEKLRMWSDCMDAYLKKATRNKQRACKNQQEELRKERHIINQKVNLS